VDEDEEDSESSYDESDEDESEFDEEEEESEYDEEGNLFIKKIWAKKDLAGTSWKNKPEDVKILL